MVYQWLTKLLSYGNVSLDKTKVLLMDLTVFAAINIERTAIHSAINIPINQFGKKITNSKQ